MVIGLAPIAITWASSLVDSHYTLHPPMGKMCRCQIWTPKHSHFSCNTFITIVNQIWAGFLSSASLSWQKPLRNMMFIRRRRSVKCKWGKFFLCSTPLQLPKVHVTSLHVENHCVGVFQYASKHGYIKLMNDSARIAVQNKYSSNEISNKCNRPDLQSAWVRAFPLHC